MILLKQMTLKAVIHTAQNTSLYESHGGLIYK